MGLFRLVARVGRLRGGATCLLEEWPHSALVNARWTEPGLQALWQLCSWSGLVADGARSPLGGAAMAKQTRSNDWGFPRWRAYGAGARGGAQVRLCDREGCNEVGDRPAPKAPNSPERWYFCEAHAAEYNKGWDYFAGLSPEEAARRAADEESRRLGLPPVGAVEMGGPRRRQPQPRRDARARCAGARRRRRVQGRQGRLPPARQGASPRHQAGNEKPRQASSRSRRPMTSSQGRGAEEREGAPSC